MERPVFIKFSNERARIFALQTEILETEDGTRSVIKRAVYPEGKAHVEEIYQHYRQLSSFYGSGRLQCNRCRQEENGIRFEYVAAETLESRMDTLIQDGQAADAAKLLESYLSLIRELPGKETFRMTDAFRRVFGDVRIPEGLESLPISNIDMLTSNIMLLDEQYVVIDYEWTFSFPIPTAYILYRILFYYLEQHPFGSALSDFHLYEKAGLDKKTCEIFRRMEFHFQRYITGGHIPMRDMYAEISPGSLAAVPGKSMSLTGRDRDEVRLYYSTGNGFCPEQAIVYAVTNGDFQETIPIPRGAVALRLDPGEKMGVCRILELSYDHGQMEPLTLSPGIVATEEGYLMDQLDPQIYLGDLPKGASALRVHLQMHAMEGSAQDLAEENLKYIRVLENQLSAVKGQMMSQEQLLGNREEEIRQLKEHVGRLETKILQMEGTKVWKAYQKYRDIRERK